MAGGPVPDALVAVTLIIVGAEGTGCGVTLFEAADAAPPQDTTAS